MPTSTDPSLATSPTRRALRERLGRWWPHHPARGPEPGATTFELPPLRALVLSGGSNRAAAQVGMARTLLEAGWSPDVVVGASAGALNAVCLAHDWSPAGLDRLEQLWRSVDGREIFPGRRFSMVLSLVRREGGLQPSVGLERFLEGNVPVRDLADTAIPVHVAVVDLSLGSTRFVHSGPANQWLAASCSIPGVLAPVELDGVRHVDGGTITPVPVTHALDLGATEVVVLDTSEPHWHRRSVPGSLDTLLGSYQAARNEVQRRDLLELQRSGLPVCWAHVDPHDLEAGDFTRCDELFARGARTCREALARDWCDVPRQLGALSRLTVTGDD